MSRAISVLDWIDYWSYLFGGEYTAHACAWDSRSRGPHGLWAIDGMPGARHEVEYIALGGAGYTRDSRRMAEAVLTIVR